MSLDVRSIMQFVVVADEGSFTRAAQRLNLAQPWLSRRILQLEEQLGFSLLERTTRRVELTAKGQAFLTAARAVAAVVSQAERAAGALRHDERSSLRIGAPPYGGRLPARNAVVARFAADHPDVALELEIGWTPLLIQRVLNGDLDGAFGIGWQDAPGLRRITLVMLKVQLRFGPSDPLAGYDRVNAAALAGRRIAVFTRGLYPALYDRAFGRLAAAGAELIQVPEIHERLIERDTGSTRLLLAEFGQADTPPGPGRLMLEDGPDIPFNVFFPSIPATLPAGKFEEIASTMRQNPWARTDHP